MALFCSTSVPCYKSVYAIAQNTSFVYDIFPGKFFCLTLIKHFRVSTINEGSIFIKCSAYYMIKSAYDLAKFLSGIILHVYKYSIILA